MATFNLFREVLIKRLTRWHEGDGAPVLDGKKLPLSHIKLYCDDGLIREITTVTWDPSFGVSKTAEGLIEYAADHVYSYHRTGTVPRYYIWVFFGGSDRHTHEFNIEPPVPNDGEPKGMIPSVNLRGGGGREAELRALDAMVQLTQMSMLNSQFDRTHLVTSQDRMIERLFGRNDKLEGGLDSLREKLDIALDRQMERDIRVANEQIKIKIKAAVAEQGIAALPAFMGLGHRMLNAKLGVKEDKPLADEADEMIGKLAEMEPNDLVNALNLLFKTKEDRDRATLLIQRYRGRKAVKQLDSRAIAAQDGVTRPVPFARLVEIAAGKPKDAGATVVQRPNPFRKQAG